MCAYSMQQMSHHDLCIAPSNQLSLPCKDMGLRVLQSCYRVVHEAPHMYRNTQYGIKRAKDLTQTFQEKSVSWKSRKISKNLVGVLDLLYKQRQQHTDGGHTHKLSTIINPRAQTYNRQILQLLLAITPFCDATQTLTMINVSSWTEPQLGTSFSCRKHHAKIILSLNKKMSLFIFRHLCNTATQFLDPFTSIPANCTYKGTMYMCTSTCMYMY